MLKRKQAFTLLEIMVVVIIVGVISTLAMPKYYLAIEKARSGEGVQMLGALYDAVRIFRFEKGTLPTDMADLEITFLNSEYFSDPVLPGLSDEVATVFRVGGRTDYELSVNIDGGINCYFADDASYCSRLGF